MRLLILMAGIFATSLFLIPPFPSLNTRTSAVLAEYAAIQNTLDAVTDQKSAQIALATLSRYSKLPALKSQKGESASEHANGIHRNHDPVVQSARRRLATTLLRLLENGHMPVTVSRDAAFLRAVEGAFYDDAKFHAAAMLEVLKSLSRSGYCDVSDGDETLLVVMGHEPSNSWGQPYRVKLVETEAGTRPVIRTSVLLSGNWTEIEIK